jgi:hypothetical protein
MTPHCLLAAGHASAYVSASVPAPDTTSAYVSIRQHTSAYVSIRQHTSAYVSIRERERTRPRHFIVAKAEGREAALALLQRCSEGGGPVA